MNFRTVIKPEKSDFRISYQSPLFFIGSCFSEEIGAYLSKGKFDVIINPFGVLYNPVSVADSLSLILEGKKFTENDLYKHDEMFLSFDHDTSFSSASIGEILGKINNALDLANLKLKNAQYLFTTFGTSWIYRFNETGRIVANCHKIPDGKFSRELLESDRIVELWDDLIKRIRSVNKDIRIVFTVSPVRHLKDGAHGNQLSKSILLVAIDRIVSKGKELSYYPSYELMMDDLRDYRFYNDDMLHPSSAAVRYIWEHFSSCYFEEDTMKLFAEIEKIQHGKEHRIIGNRLKEKEVFKKKMLERIENIQKRYPQINLEEEQEYFMGL